MKTIIIDDEPNAIQNLETLFRLFDIDLEVVATAGSAAEAIEQIDRLKPELIFLDIEMPHGNGFKVIEGTEFKDYQIIFTTAYSQYAIKALRMNALDYLVKPIDPDDLERAVKRAKQNTSKKNDNNYDELLRSHKSKTFEKLGISTSSGVRFIEFDRIIRLQSESNYTRIFIKGESPTLVSKTLKMFDEMLRDHDFIRVHQSHLVNLHYIKEFVRISGCYLLLSNGEKVVVSKSQAAKVNRIFKRI